MLGLGKLHVAWGARSTHIVVISDCGGGGALIDAIVRREQIARTDAPRRRGVAYRRHGLRVAGDEREIEEAAQASAGRAQSPLTLVLVGSQANGPGLVMAAMAAAKPGR